MPVITIDEKQIEFEQGQTIIEAARSGGISIPHFCWHPSLSISGNCRVCLVEVENIPKLVIACSTMANDGMIVHTKSEKTLSARNSVMEFILINHPLDCPICDEAGECKLQNYAYKHGTGESRFVEEKNHKRKRSQLGPHVMFDGERCISCSRCIRFSDEIAHANQLTFVQRGDRVTIETFPGEVFDNPYTLNTVDICPVGALTSSDFRFKSRVWEMSKTKSICVGCSRGCNTNIWVRDNEIQRLTPRRNDAVNERWMCDNGRLNTFENIAAENRVGGCLIKKDGDLTDVDLNEAYELVGQKLSKYSSEELAFIGSPISSVEDNFMLSELAKQFNSNKLAAASAVVPGDADDILIREDKSPNSTGVEKLGIAISDDDAYLNELIAEIDSGKIKAAYILEDDLIRKGNDLVESLKKLEFLAVHAVNQNSITEIADVVIGVSAYAEKNAIYVNFKGRAQRTFPAVAVERVDESLDHSALSRWDKFGTSFDRWRQGNKVNAVPGWKFISGVLKSLGSEVNFKMAEDVFVGLSNDNPEFEGLDYDALGDEGAVLKSYQKINAETV